MDNVRSKNNQIKSDNFMDELVILIPTCSDQESDLRIGYTLTSLAMQDCGPFHICVRDEGQVGIFSNRNIRLIWDLLLKTGHKLEYSRVLTRNGVGVARKELIGSVSPTTYALFIDDDMMLRSDSVRKLLEAATSDKKAGFFQGAKIEIDPRHGYLNDINLLNSSTAGAKLIPTVFGDAAFLLLRWKALEVVDWELITKYPLPGLPGEDVLMTLMIADKFSAWCVPSAVAHHLSPENKRWKWEVVSDVLQLELLRNRIRPETLAKALTHLRGIIPLQQERNKKNRS